VKRDPDNYREANVKSAIGNDPSLINPVNLLTCLPAGRPVNSH